MSFPTNWKKFLQEYSFLDIREVYTNGSRLIPVFRVEQMMEYFHHEWVSVKDRLPEQYTDVIVFTKNGIIDVDCLEHIMSWGEEDFCKYGDNVTHWMPLPTPPQRVKMMQNE